MKKVKIFKMVNTIILLLILGNSTALAAETSQKENLTEPKQEKTRGKNLNISKSQEKIDDEKIDSEEYEVENFKIENIYQKGETIFVSYEHIKSGAKFVVWFENLNSQAYDHLSFKDPTMFFRYIPTDNLGVAHALEHFLAIPIEEKLQNNFTSHEQIKIIGHEEIANTPNFTTDGFGFRVNIKKWSAEIVKMVTDELKDPTFLKDNQEMFSREKKRIISEINGIANYDTKQFWENIWENSELYDRFIGGKFFAYGSPKDVEKLSFETVKKAFEENIVPENMLIQISAKLNPDYKQIMRNFDESYLKNYVKKNSFEEDKQKLKSITETKPVRQIDVDYIEYTNYDPKSKNKQGAIKQKFKNKAKLYWKIENLSPKEKEIFNMSFYKNPIIMQLENEIKNLGYEIAIINNENDMRIFNLFSFSYFDNLFCLDLYGNDPSKFEEKTLKENAKKILNMIYEKIKNFEDSELLKTNLILFPIIAFPALTYYLTEYYRYENFNLLMNKSFALTNKPINEKFFDIEGQTIKDDYLNKRVLENLKKYKDKFKQIIDLPPTYIDIFTAKANNKNESFKTENETKIERYKNPITFNSSNEILKEWAEKLTRKLFLLPNINDKGLCYNFIYFPFIECLNTEIEKIEEYLFGKFIADFKNFKPTMEQFEKLNDDDKKSNLLEMNELENQIKELNESLKNPKILKKLAVMEKQMSLNFEIKIKNDIEHLETLKNEENNEKIQEIIKRKQTVLKEISDNKDNIEYFINKAKEGTDSQIGFFKMRLDGLKKRDELRSKITYEDFVNIFKNAEIKNSSHLEKY